MIATFTQEFTENHFTTIETLDFEGVASISATTVYPSGHSTMHVWNIAVTPEIVIEDGQLSEESLAWIGDQIVRDIARYYEMGGAA